MRIENPTESLPLRSLEGPLAPAAIGKASDTSFADLLTSAVDSANKAGKVAEAKADGVARGVLDDVHGTMISAKEAEISLKLVGNIRNKLLDAFHELWRTSV